MNNKEIKQAVLFSHRLKFIFKIIDFRKVTQVNFIESHQCGGKGELCYNKTAYESGNIFFSLFQMIKYNDKTVVVTKVKLPTCSIPVSRN